MGKLTEEDLEALYPTAKSQEQKREELQARMLARRPKRVSSRTSFYVSLAVVILLTSNRLITLSLSGDSSLGGVLAGTALAMLLALVTLGLIWYMYRDIYALLSRTEINILAVKTVAVITMVISFGLYLAIIWFEQGLLMAVALPLIFSYLLMYSYMRFGAIKIQS